MSQFRSTLLDVDGTLVNSNDAHTNAWVEAFSAHGLKIPFSHVRPLIGMGGDHLMPKVSGIQADSEQGQRIEATRLDIFMTTFLPTSHATRGATELLKLLKQRGHRLIVATSAKKAELNGLLTIFHGDEVIDETTSSDEADESKPEPDIIHAAIEKSGFPPFENILLGDTRYDIIAGLRAQVSTIAFRSGGSSDADLEGAIAIYDDPAQLLAHFDKSVLA